MNFQFLFASLVLPLAVASSELHKELHKYFHAGEFKEAKEFLKNNLQLLTRFDPSTWYLALNFYDYEDEEDVGYRLRNGNVIFTNMRGIAVFMADNFEDVNARVNNNTPLSVAVFRGNSYAINRLLRRKELDVNLAYMENSDRTPLFLAINRLDSEIAELLINNGADVNSTCDGLTILHHACRIKLGLDRDKILRYLINNGAKIRIDGPQYQISSSRNYGEECILKAMNAANLELYAWRRNRILALTCLLLLVFRIFYIYFGF